eukprot:CAMPEP_0168577764 /NCGR_PEP_ID=MMETSP0413-20121227/20960_1 /TAXON_ID=136452 /ORGANISM="Filamoeba nolandi, Strain NC-AS-23-1" /LENGTH=147 /DNA_ID=CAMNT_0008611539 /DNA_START=300 /DNA_END=740 /DNA_ORIENTATION=+
MTITDTNIAREEVDLVQLLDPDLAPLLEKTIVIIKDTEEDIAKNENMIEAEKTNEEKETTTETGNTNEKLKEVENTKEGKENQKEAGNTIEEKETTIIEEKNMREKVNITIENESSTIEGRETESIMIEKGTMKETETEALKENITE